MLGFNQKFISSSGSGAGSIGSTKIIAVTKITADMVLSAIPVGYVLIALIINNNGIAGTDIAVESGAGLADILPNETIQNASYNPYSVYFMKSISFAAYNMAVRGLKPWANVSLDVYIIIQRII